VHAYLERRQEAQTDAPARETAALLRDHYPIVLELLERAATAAQELRTHPRPTVLCHTDLHAGNLLLAQEDRLYLVDWDQPLLAPKERDLMFIGGGQGFQGVSPAEEASLFYRAYGAVEIDSLALSYYRCERIIQDIAEFCKQLLDGTPNEANRADREQSVVYLSSIFLPGGTIEFAFRSAPPRDPS
jgi:spectinomycin phosphotransferase